MTHLNSGVWMRLQTPLGTITTKHLFTIAQQEFCQNFIFNIKFSNSNYYKLIKKLLQTTKYKTNDQIIQCESIPETLYRESIVVEHHDILWTDGGINITPPKICYGGFMWWKCFFPILKKG